MSSTSYKNNNNEYLYTQIDDFPKLVQQMNGKLAEELLEKVINFNELI